METVVCRAAIALPCARAGPQHIPVRSLGSPSEPKSFAPEVSAGAPVLSQSSTAEAPRNAQSSSIVPLPLTSRTVLPGPLRFLWFTKDKDDKATNTDDPGKNASFPMEERVHGISLRDEDVDSTTLDNGAKNSVSIDGLASRAEEFEGTQYVEPVQIITTSTSGTETGSVGEDSSMSANGASRSWVPNLGHLKFFWRQNSGDERAVASPTMVCGCPGCEADSMQARQGISQPIMEESTRISILLEKDSFADYLHQVPLSELKLITQLAFLSNQAYFIPEIEPAELLTPHNLIYVTSSLERKAAAKENLTPLPNKEGVATTTPSGVVAEGEFNSSNVQANGALDSSSAETEGGHDSSNIQDINKQESSSGAAAATYALAASAASYLQSYTKAILHFKDGIAVGDYRGGFGDFVSRNILERVPKDNDNSKKLEAILANEGDDRSLDAAADSKDAESGLSSAVTSSSAAATLAPVVAEEESKQAVANKLQSQYSCPCEWFVCDDPGIQTRHFVIQGTDSLASWQANLLFEPTQFEGPELGVRVHRGIYEAAKGLYEQLIPLVLEHIEAFGEKARFRFTGHSLGGSLATLLPLMLRHRDVVPSTALLPVYTFGSPCIMCGGDYLLEQLGLPQSLIQSVAMHFDIVPRTFSCVYPDHVAEVLKRVNGIFRSHSCLLQQRLLYAPMGQLVILQPEQEQAPPHPLLPVGGGLYAVRYPNYSEPQEHDGDFSPASRVRSAERLFFNTPHPLEILSDPAAYGTEGTISKNHDSRSYLKALRTKLRHELKGLRRLQRKQRRQQWGPLISADIGITPDVLNGDVEDLRQVAGESHFSLRNDTKSGLFK